jgi:putative tributyrin esterase
MWLTTVLMLAQASSGVQAQSAGRVETLHIASGALGVQKDVSVYLPPSYDKSNRPFPTVYYLHGASGNERTWLEQFRMERVVDSLVEAGAPEAIIVMPDGDRGYWTDWASPTGFAEQCARDSILIELQQTAPTFCVKSGRYETYVVSDVVPAIDSRYRTIHDRKGRAIAGNSMGGYGAWFLSLRHPELWSVAVSHSGVLQPLYVAPHPFDGHPRYASSVKEALDRWPVGGPLSASRRNLFMIEFGPDTAGWWARDPLRQLLRLQNSQLVPDLYSDVGTSDGFADQNRAMADSLRRMGVPNSFHEWPGDHEWNYWRAHVPVGLAWVLAHFVKAD